MSLFYLVKTSITSIALSNKSQIVCLCVCEQSINFWSCYKESVLSQKYRANYNVDVSQVAVHVENSRNGTHLVQVPSGTKRSLAPDVSTGRDVSNIQILICQHKWLTDRKAASRVITLCDFVEAYNPIRNCRPNPEGHSPNIHRPETLKFVTLKLFINLLQ
jgi:hypothetical protein